MHPETSITLVLPSNQELWSLKPNRGIIPALIHNNKITDFVGLTNEKELHEYLGNGTRMTRTSCMYMYLVLFSVYELHCEHGTSKAQVLGNP